MYFFIIVPPLKEERGSKGMAHYIGKKLKTRKTKFYSKPEPLSLIGRVWCMGAGGK